MNLPRPSLLQILPVAAALSLALSGVAPAATISVTATIDTLANDGKCTLREAITAANKDAASGAAAGECEAGSGPDVVVLPAARYDVGSDGANDDANVKGDLDLDSAITIDGAGRDTTIIDGIDADDRVVDVVGGTAVIEGVTITGGRARSGAAGGNGTTGGFGGVGQGGGGIQVDMGAALTLEDSRVVGNRSGDGGSGGNGAGNVAGGAGNGGFGGPGGSGGGIRNDGALTVLRSEIAENQSGRGGDGGDASGGGGTIAPGGSGAAGGTGGFASGGIAGQSGPGGGIYSTGTLTIRNSLIRANRTGAGGSGGDARGGGGGFGDGTAAGGAGGSASAGLSGYSGSGGGVSWTGATTIADTVVRDNATGDGGAGGQATGGGGGAGGTSSGAGGAGGNADASGGGIAGAGAGLKGSGNASIVRTTVAGNGGGAGGPGGSAKGGTGMAGRAPNGNGGAGGNATGGDGGLGGGGGGIAVAEKTTEIVNSTITGNAAGPGGDAGTATGGNGAARAGSGVPGNGGNATGRDGGDGGNGGGISAGDDATLTIRHATVSGNAASTDAGTAGSVTSGSGAVGGSSGNAKPGAPGDPGAVGGILVRKTGSAARTIVSANTPANCSGVTDGGGNVSFPDATCAGLNADPLLGALAANGGATPTQALGAGSPAIDLVPAEGCETEDQRGLPRPSGAACDAGAFEVQPAPAGGPEDPGPDVGPTGGEGPAADVLAPSFLSASLRPRVFAVNRRTVIRYRLSEAARVVFTVQRAKSGRRAGGRCVKPSRANRGRPGCTRWVRVARVSQQATAAPMRKRLSRRVGTRRLRPGRHRVVLVATDAAGNTSAAKRLRFRIVRAG